jgi:hypothetical protein
MKFNFICAINYSVSILLIVLFFSIISILFIFIINNLGNLLKEGFHKDATEVNYPIKTTHSPYDFTINYNLSSLDYGKILDTTPYYENKIMKNNDYIHKRATHMEYQPHLSMINPGYESTSTYKNNILKDIIKNNDFNHKRTTYVDLQLC